MLEVSISVISAGSIPNSRSKPMKRHLTQPKSQKRKGTTTVEVAVMLLWLFPVGIAMIEFGHCFMTIHTINAAAQRAARAGVGDTSTTQEVVDLADDILGSAINVSTPELIVLVKDGSQFDDPTFDPKTLTSYASLPDADLVSTPTHTLFIVRIEVPYSKVGILGGWFLKDLNLSGQAVMRKE